MKVQLSRLSSIQLAQWLRGGCIVLVVVLIAQILMKDWLLIDGKRLGSDATQNLNSAVNYVLHGIYSEQPVSADVEPGFRREPFPNLVLALILGIVKNLFPEYLDLEAQPFHSDLLILAKSLNLFYAGILFLGLWACLLLVLKPAWFACGASLFVISASNHFFVKPQLNNLNTELVAGVLLVWISVVLLKAQESRLGRWAVLGGILIGFIALVKAIGAYSALFLLPVLALLISRFGKRFWASFFALTLGFLIVVTPWVARNYYQFGRTAIAEGAGDVLLIRSVFNEMDHQQLAHSFFAFSPVFFQEAEIFSTFGVSESDLKCGGSLHVFARSLDCDNEAIAQERYADVKSFYQRGKRALPRLLGLTREEKKEFAIQRIVNNPLSHLMATPSFGWRGLWSFEINHWGDAFLNFLAFACLFAAPLIGWCEKRIGWILISAVPLSYFWMYAITSHFIPRYSRPLIPIALVCMVMVVVDCFSRLIDRKQTGYQSSIGFGFRCR